MLVPVAVAAVSRMRRPRTVPVLGLETVTVLPGLHHIAGLGPSPAYAVETTEGVVLVDSGLEADATGVTSGRKVEDLAFEIVATLPAHRQR